jgi:hypothetical protein
MTVFGSARGALLACVATATWTAAVSAEFRILDEAALREAVTGKTVTLQTAVGTIPISFKADGTMIGRSTDMVNYLGRGFDQGVWWIAGNQLCQRWKLWLDGKSYCFTLRQNGQQVHWTRNDGMKGQLVVSN